MIPESFRSRTRPRRSFRGFRRTTSPDPAQVPSLGTGEWSVNGSTLVAPNGIAFELVRHGLEKDLASRIASRATVVFGDFPSLTDITGDPKRVEDAVVQASPRGELFTVYASEYRLGTETALLLDYLR